MTDAQEIKQISDYLNKEKRISCEVSKDSDGLIVVSIENGDWKHDHIACTYAMIAYGYNPIREDYDEDTCDSDSYTADHYFKKYDKRFRK